MTYSIKFIYRFISFDLFSWFIEMCKHNISDYGNVTVNTIRMIMIQFLYIYDFLTV